MKITVKKQKPVNPKISLRNKKAKIFDLIEKFVRGQNKWDEVSSYRMVFDTEDHFYQKGSIGIEFIWKDENWNEVVKTINVESDNSVFAVLNEEFDNLILVALGKEEKKRKRNEALAKVKGLMTDEELKLLRIN